MALEVAPTPVRRRRSLLPAVAVLVAVLAVVAVAWASAGGGPAERAGRGPAPGAGVEAPGSPSAPAPASPVATVPARLLRLPRTLECHDLASAACDRLALASLAVLPTDGPPVWAIDAWGSILCGDDLDCPRARLAGSVPLGSAVVTFAGGGPRAWVNVVVPAPAPGTRAAAPFAWIVRWRP